jgi:hypothetical protein
VSYINEFYKKQQRTSLLEGVVFIRCIFCKCDSTNSKSVEHILPESLGNKAHFLPRGIVCDGCNNYLAREVEKPFLENDSIKALRFEEGIISKKGRIPTINGVLLDDHGQSVISITRPPEFQGPMIHMTPLFLEYKGGAVPGESGKIKIPMFDLSGSFPNGTTLSRFLGKIALEVMAFRLSENPENIEYFVDEAQLDDLRNHVRYGVNKNWPCCVRQIYNKNILNSDERTGELFQITNEFDILHTENNEYYLVLAIFGIEYVINFGGPEISGYYNWLSQHYNESPLYIK